MIERFIEIFKKAVLVEMEAMKDRLGPFEVPLLRGRILEGAEVPDNAGHFHYSFQIGKANDKIVLGIECNLVAGSSDHLVTVTRIEGEEIVVRGEQAIDAAANPLNLVIYPWFLYEKLLIALQSLVDSDTFHVDSAVTLFGKMPPLQLPAPTDEIRVHEELNDSQQRAVQLCCEVTPAFVWGPPGTGKTTTLGYIVATLLRRQKRILVTSTTNAAVDQALAKLAELEEPQEALQRGQIIRLGQTQEETFGAGLREVSERLDLRRRDRMGRLRERQEEIGEQLEVCERLLSKLPEEGEPSQLELFGAADPASIGVRELEELFSPGHAHALSESDPERQRQAIERRRQRLERCLVLCGAELQRLFRQQREQETWVVDNARLILSTMTNVYISTLMREQRFDVVIVEEAGMAVLPTLFYCATLARSQVIMVGDPQQLPPIVQSNERYVRQAMGRSIFQVTVPEPHQSDLVVMLDTQYRMHPAIGDLVGGLFYDGRLRHGNGHQQQEGIAARAPFAGAPVVVVDTEGRTACATPQGSYSRFNDATAAACVNMAHQAVADGIESVAVITPYVEQAKLIRRRLADHPELQDRVECRTVHRFQGGERDMVIFDTVDAEPLAPGMLLSSTAPGSD